MKIKTYCNVEKFNIFEGEKDCYILPSIRINFDLKYVVFNWLYLSFEIDFLK